MEVDAQRAAEAPDRPEMAEKKAKVEQTVEELINTALPLMQGNSCCPFGQNPAGVMQGNSCRRA